MHDYPSSGHSQGHVTHFYILGLCHIFGADEARHFKFGLCIECKEYCHYTLHMLKFCSMGVHSGSHGLLKFWEISANISKRYKIEIWLQWKTNRKSHVSYQMLPISMTMSDLECHFSCF